MEDNDLAPHDETDMARLLVSAIDAVERCLMSAHRLPLGNETTNLLFRLEDDINQLQKAARLGRRRSFP